MNCDPRQDHKSEPWLNVNLSQCRATQASWVITSMRLSVMLQLEPLLAEGDDTDPERGLGGEQSRGERSCSWRRKHVSGFTDPTHPPPCKPREAGRQFILLQKSAGRPLFLLLIQPWHPNSHPSLQFPPLLREDTEPWVLLSAPGLQPPQLWKSLRSDRQMGCVGRDQIVQEEGERALGTGAAELTANAPCSGPEQTDASEPSQTQSSGTEWKRKKDKETT